MKDNYLNYNLEDLLNDKSFVEWIKGNESNVVYDKLLSESSEFNNIVREARRMVNICENNIDNLTGEEILLIWKNVKIHYHSERNKLRKIHVYKTVSKYAAIILLVFSIGSVASYFIINAKSELKFLTQNTNLESGEASLILSRGDVVPLIDNSKIIVKSKKELLINNTNSISLEEEGKPLSEETRMNELIVPYGKRTSVILDDSTKVWLCAGSRLAFPTTFTGDKREIYLQGEAYLEVFHDANRPFIVITRDMKVKVLGTKFYLSAYSNDEEVTTVLLEGKVTLTENDAMGLIRKATVLEPGQKAVFDKSKKIFEINKEENTELYIAWTKGWFNFSKESVMKVFKKLERFYNIKFIYEEPFNSVDQITGKLDLKDSISDVMMTLAKLSNFSYKINKDSISVKQN